MDKKWFIILQLTIALDALSGVASKMARLYADNKIAYVFWMGMVFVLMGLFAVIWQQILKHMSLTFATTFRPFRSVYTLLLCALIFSEHITLRNGIGVLLIIAGILIGAGGDENTGAKSGNG
ncbi:MAG: EamA family transporter [Lachnospiraceae bacterium]|nr:EamA family transporter [Lachnospiraceae bacterium]